MCGENRVLSRVNVPTDCMHAIANHGMLILGPAPSQVLNLKDPGEIEFPQLNLCSLAGIYLCDM